MGTQFSFANGRGQRSLSVRFHRREGASLRPLGEVHPIFGASINQNGTRSLMRTATLNLGEVDSAATNFVSDRLDISMLLDGREWKLGRFLFTDVTQQEYFDENDRPRTLAACQLTDSMAILDGELETAFTSVLEPARAAIERLVSPFNFDAVIEDSPYLISNSWMAGTTRRQVLEAIAQLGGYLPPWFNHEGVLRAIRQFDPTAGTPDFDFDVQQNVFAESVSSSDSTIYAPNRIVVVSNGGNTYGGSSSEKNPVDPIDPGPLMAFCDAPSTAPHSVLNLGFARPQVFEIQAVSGAQCQAVADLLCLTQTVVEDMQLSTSLDPRHDGWNTVKFQGDRWLETGWSMDLEAGGAMGHQLQRSYPPSAEILSGTAGSVTAEGV